MDQYDTKIDHIIYIGQWPVYMSVTYSSWSSDSALYLENYLMDDGQTLDNGSVSQQDGPHKIYVGQWPLFHGPAILI